MTDNQPKMSPDKRSISVTKILNAPIETIWKLWTEPYHIKEWWGPDGFTNTIQIMEVKIGGRWEFVMRGPDGTDYQNNYIYKEVIKNKRLLMRHLDHPPFQVSVDFHQQGDQTRLEIRSECDKAEDLKFAIENYNADKGFAENMNKMEEYSKAITK